METTRLGTTQFKVKGKNAVVTFGEKELAVGDFKITGPGEYEIAGVTVLALRDSGKLVFRAKIDKVIFLYPACLLEQIDGVDVLFTGSSESVSKIEPKMVIPFGEDESVKKIIKDLGKEGLVKQPKITISADRLPDNLEVIYL